jgi:type IV pilus assembly protein PilO
MGALDNFARKSTNYKVAVFAVIGVVLGGLYYQFVFKKHRSARDEARDNNGTLLSRSQKLDRDAKEYQKLLARSDELNRQIEENQKALPTEAELPAFFDTLGRKVGEAGVEVKRWDYLKEVPVESFTKVPIEIEITGSYYQLKRFFASLVQKGTDAAEPSTTPEETPVGTTPERERIVTIENLSLFDPRVRNRELVMTAKFIASTFRQDQAAAAKSAAPAPAKAAPKPGAGSAAAPPAATPAGAKARTEDALKKSEERAGTAAPDKLKEGTP